MGEQAGETVLGSRQSSSIKAASLRLEADGQRTQTERRDLQREGHWLRFGTTIS